MADLLDPWTMLKRMAASVVTPMSPEDRERALKERANYEAALRLPSAENKAAAQRSVPATNGGWSMSLWRVVGVFMAST